MAVPSLKGEIVIRTTVNGFIVVYLSQEFIFPTVQELNKWLVQISAGS